MKYVMTMVGDHMVSHIIPKEHYLERVRSGTSWIKVHFKI